MTQEETTQVTNNVASPDGTDSPAQPDENTATAQVTESPLEAQLAEFKKQAQENLDSKLRTLAEFQNYKRRVERDLSEIGNKSKVDVLVRLLPVIDDFERAMSDIPEEIANLPWVNGVSLIQRNFQRLLDEYQVAVIDPKGQPFDPNQHEAVSMEPNDEVESGNVIETLRKGYAYGDKILRPALVRVAQ